MIKPRVSITDSNITISLVVDNSLAVAELSKIPSALAQEFLKEASEAPKYKELVRNSIGIIENTAEIYFFNRLNVPHKIQDQGLGSILLEELEKIMKEKSGFIVNTANAYGEMAQKELISFYERHNFRLVHKDGLMVYHPSLINKKLKNNLPIKMQR